MNGGAAVPLPTVVRYETELMLLAYCQLGTPEDTQDKFRLAFRTREDSITLYECHGPWNPAFPKESRRPIAQFRYISEQQAWALFWADAKLKWHLYHKLQPTADFPQLIVEVHTDPDGVFFK